jgi:hypothetical protein
VFGDISGALFSPRVLAHPARSVKPEISRYNARSGILCVVAAGSMKIDHVIYGVRDLDAAVR